MCTCRYCHGQTNNEFSRQGRLFRECKTCGAILQVLEKDQGYYTYDEFIENIKLVDGLEPAFGKLEEVRAFLRFGSLLEIGPGTGRLLAAAKQKGFDACGIDPDPYVANFIQQTWGVDVINSPLEEADIPDNSFDSVVSFNCIEHVKYPIEHAKTVYRILKPGGRFIVSTCSAQSLQYKLTGKYWSQLKVPDHYSIASPKSFEYLAKLSSLELLKMWSTERPLETPVTMVVSVKDLLQETWLKAPPKSGSSTPSESNTQQNNNKSRALQLTRLASAVNSYKGFSFVSRAINARMLGGNIKAVFEKPA